MTPTSYEQDLAETPDVLARVLPANAAQLDAARRLLGSARVVRLAALGSSRHAAGYGAQVLDVLAGRPATVLPAPGRGVPTPQLGPADVLITVSQSGATPALLALVQEARTAGTAVIAVTNDPAAPLAGLATVALDCAAGPERVIAATKSVAASMLLLRALADRPPDAASAVAAALATPLPELGAIPERVVAGGFAAEAVADEVALKLAEVCGRNVTAEPLVDYLHGPAAVPARTLALVGPDDANVGALGHDVLRAGPDPSYDVVLPAAAEPSLDPIVRAVAGMRLAGAWALAHGEDPDAARGLSKVTCSR